MQGIYVISVASRLLAMHPQTLRKYERMGWIAPSRSVGMLRLYSDEDIARLRVIKYLIEVVGLNLAGVEMALSLLKRLLTIRRQFNMLDASETIDEFLSQVRLGLEEILTMLNAGPASPIEHRPVSRGGDLYDG